MAIYYKKDIAYLAYYPEGKRGGIKHIRLGELPRKEAQEVADKITNVKNTKSAVQGTTFSDLWPHYLDYVSMKRKPATFADVEVSGRHLEKIFKDVNLTWDLQGYIALYEHRRQKDGVKNRTINKELSWLSGFLVWCKKYTTVKINKPLIEKLPSTRPIPIVLTADEVKRIFQQCNETQHLFFSLLFMCGLRLREVSNLKRKDIDFEKKLLVVLGKGGKYRFVPVPDYCLNLLKDYQHGSNKEYLFTTSTGKPLYHISMQMKRIAKKAGIEKNVYPHLLRHSYATYLVERGINLEIVKNLLGHSDIQTTTFYTHVAIEHLQGASDLMQNAICQGSIPQDTDIG